MDWIWWPAARGVAFDGWVALPGVWLFVAVVWAAELWWERGRTDASVRRHHGRLFAVAGSLLLWLALDWPVGTLAAGHLLTVRTAQYMLLTFVAVPLILLGLGPTRGATPARGVRGMNALSHPLIALPLFAIVLGATHFPAAVDALAPHAWGVFAIDVAWLASALVFWWRILGPEPDARRMPYLGVMVYLVVPFLLTKIPGLVFAFQGDPLFASFAAGPDPFGLAHGIDQQAAGFLLWFVGSAMVLAALAVVFFRWQAEDRRMATSDSLAIPADPRALELLFAVPGAWATLEAVVAGITDAVPAGTHGAELAFAYRDRPGAGATVDASAGTQVILELQIALDGERERALARQIDRVMTECLGRLTPPERIAVASRFTFRLVTYGTRVS